MQTKFTRSIPGDRQSVIEGSLNLSSKLSTNSSINPNFLNFILAKNLSKKLEGIG